MSKGIVVEIPLPRGRSSQQPRAFQNLVLRLTRVSTGKLSKELYWYMGWRLGKLLYLDAYAIIWRGLADFLVASDRLKHTGPLPNGRDRPGIRAFYEEMQEKLRAERPDRCQRSD